MAEPLSPAVAPRVLGVVLAGGLSRRMGGGDKALRPIGGRAALAHVVDRLRPQCAALVLNANGDPRRFAGYGLAVVADDVPDRPGPLAGLLAALDHAAARHPDLDDVVSVAADTPFVPRDLVAGLARARAAAGAAVAIAASGGRHHPVIGLWPVALRAELRQALAGGERRVGAFAAGRSLAVAEWPTEPVDPFFNVNRPEDLDAADAMAGLLRD